MRTLRRPPRAVCVVLLALALLGTGVAEDLPFWCPASGVAYGVTLSPAEHMVHVDAATHQPAKEFQLPVWNALYQIRNFSVNVIHVQAYEGVPAWMCDGCATREAQAEKLDKTTWEVSTSGNHPCLTFSYDVRTDAPGPYGASLDAQHGFFNWAEVLVYRPDQRNAPVSLRILNLPEGWREDGGGIFAAPPDDSANATFKAASYDRLVDSPAMLGELYESSFLQDGTTYRVIVDSPRVNMEALDAMLRRITSAAVNWMQDSPGDEYTFLFLSAHGVGGGGMEHADSAVIDVDGALQRDVLSSADFAAHEFFHLWNVKRIRPQSLQPVDYAREQYTRALWFSEGVTCTAADIIEMRAGLTDEPHLLAHLASVITALQSRSAHRTQSAEEASLDTWFDAYPAYRRADRSISYYNKGELLGFLIDLEMRRLTHGRRCLRDLFQYMNEHYAKAGRYFDDSEGVRLALQAVTGNDFRDFFARYVSGVQEIPYDQFFGYVGLSLQHSEVTKVYTGFAASSAPGEPPRIVQVDDGSAASRLRLQPGDAILSANGQELTGDWDEFLRSQNPRERLRLKVKTRSGEMLILDLPLSTRKIDEYRFVDKPGATPEERSRCAAFLRGDEESVAP